MREVESELMAEGEALLSRRAELERAIARDHRGSLPALTVQTAQAARQRDRVREELRRITEEADEAGPREVADEDEADPGYGEAPAPEDFYAARSRLAARDRELVGVIEGLERRMAGLRKAPFPPSLAALEAQREQVEAQLRVWRSRCRRLGTPLTLARFDEFAGAGVED